MALRDLPNELLHNITLTLDVTALKSLRCVCSEFRGIFSDDYMCDLRGIKLYDHQRDAVKFLLDRESKHLHSLLNLDTGIGKTAVVLYAYNKNPVETLVVLKRKHVIIWENELKKYNIKLRIMTVKQVITEDVSHYKRIIIDEVHEKLFNGIKQADDFVNATKHAVIWGLSASNNLLSVSGGYKHKQTKLLFGDPTSMITVKISQLDAILRNKFKLPNFHVINSLDYTTIKDREAYIAISRYLQSVWLRFRDMGHYQFTIYTAELHQWVDHNTNMVCKHIDNTGVITLDGIQYSNVDIIKWTDMYSALMSYDFDEIILPLITGKRSIIYGYANTILHRLGYTDKVAKHSPPVKCKMFMEGTIDTLVLPHSYNAGYNFGHIDVVIIRSCDDYTTFKQIMGRINRLDQQNTTDVYLLYTPMNVDSRLFINKYKKEFE